MKKIVILTQYFLPEMGAPQNRLFDMANGLIKAGWEVSVVTAMPNYPTGKIFQSHKGKFSQTERIEDLEVKRFWLFPSNAPKVFPRIVSMLSFSFTCLFALFFIRSKKPDYLFVESPPLTLAFSGWILSILSSTKLILNVSDLWPLSAKELGAISDGRVYRGLEKFEHFLYRRAFICSGQSQEIVDHISVSAPDKIYLLRNGVDTSRFTELAYNPTKRNHIVYAGLLGVAQGILSICKNIDFKKLNTEFHIYGTGAEQESIVAFLRENPGLGIFYQGILKRDEIPSMLGSYGGTLIPLVKNIYGAVPSKIYEAMAAGLPIIFSGEGEGAAIISKQNAGWVSKPGNWQTLENALHEFLSLNQDAYFRLRANNRKTADQYFDRNKQLTSWSKFLVERMN